MDFNSSGIRLIAFRTLFEGRECVLREILGRIREERRSGIIDRDLTESGQRVIPIVAPTRARLINADVDLVCGRWRLGGVN